MEDKTKLEEPMNKDWEKRLIKLKETYQNLIS